MAKIIVDGKEVEVPDHYTLLQAAEAAGAPKTPKPQNPFLFVSETKE